MSVAAVLDRLAAWADWAEARGLFWPGPGYHDPGNRARRCMYDALDGMYVRPMRLKAEAERRIEDAALQLGWRSGVDANDRGGLPAVRAMIARAREGAGDGD